MLIAKNYLPNILLIIIFSLHYEYYLLIDLIKLLYLLFTFNKTRFYVLKMQN